MDPKAKGFDFPAIQDFFKESTEVMPKHIAAEAYNKQLPEPLHKMMIYIIMDDLFKVGKAKSGDLGYYVKCEYEV